MSTKNFVADKDLGEAAERTWLSHLRSKDASKGLDIEYIHTDGYFPDYDIADLSRDFTYEVKYDTISQRTGNFYFEYFNPKRGSASGLMTSKADYLVYIHRGSRNGQLAITADVFSLPILQAHIEEDAEGLYQKKTPRQDAQRSNPNMKTSWGAPLESGLKNALGYTANQKYVRKNKKATGWISEVTILNSLLDPLLM